MSIETYEIRRMASAPQTLFGLRLRAARKRAGIPQDRLGVMIGLDEGCSSARMSRCETGMHEPPFPVAQQIANALNIPVTYLYCENDTIADMLLLLHGMSQDQIERSRDALLAVKLDV